MLERIRKLCLRKRISIAKLERDLGKVLLAGAFGADR